MYCGAVIDPLTQVLVATRAGGAVLVRGDFGAPWGIAFRKQQRSIFHVVTRGTCWLLSESRKPQRLVQGDMVLLAHGTGHRLASAPDVKAVPLDDLVARDRIGKEEVVLRYGGRGERAALVCGAYRFDHESAHPVLGALPPVLACGSNAATADVIRLLTAEYTEDQPGAAAAISHLVDVLLVYVLREWLAQPGGRRDWLPALRDPQIRIALGAIHAAPATDWTVDRLAKLVGVSRATLVRKFAKLVGCAPLAYVTRWRLDSAARRLRDTDATLAEVATSVGYTSEFAFSKAFRRMFDMPPSEYRRRPAPPPWR
jgi:AraC-like DNA-binding protein